MWLARLQNAAGQERERRCRRGCGADTCMSVSQLFPLNQRESLQALWESDGMSLGRQR